MSNLFVFLVLPALSTFLFSLHPFHWLSPVRPTTARLEKTLLFFFTTILPITSSPLVSRILPCFSYFLGAVQAVQARPHTAPIGRYRSLHYPGFCAVGRSILFGQPKI